MHALLDSVFRAFRRSRAPLTAGALVGIAVWIQLADQFPTDWSATPIGVQGSKIFDSLQGIGVATLLILCVGVMGSVSTRVSSLLLEPPMRWLVVRWQERCAVRKHLRSNRRNDLDVGGNESEIAYELVKRRRRFCRNAIEWVRDWVPGKSVYVAYHTENFWLEPKWDRKIVGWVAGQIVPRLRSDRSTEPLREMRRRLSGEHELKSLIIDLEQDLERSPSSPFIGDDNKGLVERLDAVSSENDYRIAVMPALLLLLASIGLTLWSWSLLFSPIVILVYGSSLAKRDDTTLLVLGWLLDGRGSSHALDAICLWADREADRMNS